VRSEGEEFPRGVQRSNNTVRRERGGSGSGSSLWIARGKDEVRSDPRGEKKREKGAGSLGDHSDAKDVYARTQGLQKPLSPSGITSRRDFANPLPGATGTVAW